MSGISGAPASTTIAVSGESALTGNVTLSEGEGVTLTQDGQDIEISSSGGTPRGYIDGCITSNGTDDEHDIDFAAGVCRDDSNTDDMVLSAITKQIDAAWSVGDNAGGLDTGSVTTDTWYHLWVIKRSDTGVVDALFSTSATSPTMPTNYDKKRRIGAVLTDGSSNIIAYLQVGDRFYWDSPVQDYVADNPGTAAITITLTVPTGIKVIPLTAFQTRDDSPATTTYVIVSDPDLPDTSPSSTVNTYRVASVSCDADSVYNIAEHTNTSGQIRFHYSNSDAGVKASAATRGWIDPRGRNA